MIVELAKPSAFSRRTLLWRGGAIAGLAALGGCGRAHTSSPQPQVVRPLHADSVNSAFGIQIHSSYVGSVYSQYGAIADLLTGLGVRCVRDRLSPAAPDSLSFLRHLGAIGIKTHATIGVFPSDDNERNLLSGLARSMAAELDSLEGYNEPNGPGRPADWAQLTADHQQWLCALGRRLNLLVGSPALNDQVSTLQEDYRELKTAGIGSLCDVISMHRYPSGGLPSSLIDVRATLARSALGDKTVYCTEGGYFTAVNYTGGAQPVSESAQAIYAPRQLMEYVRRGMRFWEYELMDDPDPSGADRESHLGIVAAPSLDPSLWRKKPAYYALQQLLALTADPGPSIDLPPLEVTVEGPSDLRWIALRKRDGSRYLVLWRDVTVYDPANQLMLSTEPAAVRIDMNDNMTVRLDGRLQVVRLAPFRSFIPGLSA